MFIIEICPKNHHLIAVILDFEAILNFPPMLLEHFYKKLLILTYNVNSYHCHAINLSILSASCTLYILAVILDFGGHLGFLKSGSQTDY
jgi:hypothetical protein